MMDTTQIKNISANFMRAQQAEADGNSRRTLHYLLFAAQDIVELLKTPRSTTNDVVMARQYAESLMHTSVSIERLLNEELNVRNTL